MLIDRSREMIARALIMCGKMRPRTRYERFLVSNNTRLFAYVLAENQILIRKQIGM